MQPDKEALGPKTYKTSKTDGIGCTKNFPPLAISAWGSFRRPTPDAARRTALALTRTIPATALVISGIPRAKEKACPDPSIRGACCVVTSGSHPHVLLSYAPVRSLAPPCTRRLLDGQGFQGVTTLPTDYGPGSALAPGPGTGSCLQADRDGSSLPKVVSGGDGTQ